MDIVELLIVIKIIQYYNKFSQTELHSCTKAPGKFLKTDPLKCQIYVRSINYITKTTHHYC